MASFPFIMLTHVASILRAAFKLSEASISTATTLAFLVVRQSDTDQHVTVRPGLYHSTKDSRTT